MTLQQNISGTWTTLETKNNCTSNTDYTFNVGLVNTSTTKNYRVIVTDSYSETGQSTLNVSISTLSITGSVGHTTAWENHRVNYNLSKTGSPNLPRFSAMFFPGERLMLSANTTTIAGSRPDLQAVSVEVSIQGESHSGVNLGTYNGINWTGSIWYPQMLNWADGVKTVVFKATYSNGYVATTSVDIYIVDDKYWRQRNAY